MGCLTGRALICCESVRLKKKKKKAFVIIVVTFTRRGVKTDLLTVSFGSGGLWIGLWPYFLCSSRAEGTSSGAPWFTI